jgi:uncharacterized LabA/DUF88 family protein
MRVAVFVDAGYLYAQGSAALAGKKQPRRLVSLNVDKTLAALNDICEAACPQVRLLRIYWYDGLSRSGRMNSEQQEIASAPYAKLKLGVINGAGEQKGVDSLIVTDLIDLARNKAISDAVVVSGDEDIRIGVQIAQSFGVQVHLIGIKPARGSQSPDLIQESDTHHEMDERIVSGFLTVHPEADDVATIIIDQKSSASVAENPSDQVLYRSIMDAVLDSLDQATMDSALRAYKLNSLSVPPEIDRPALGRLKHARGRELAEEERRTFRQYLKSILDDL